MSSEIRSGAGKVAVTGMAVIARGLVAAALTLIAAAAPAVATADPVVQFFDLGLIDNTPVGRLEYRTPGDYTDIYNFEVSAEAYSFAAAVGSAGVPGPDFGVTILDVTLFDEDFNVLASDFGGSDVFLAESVLPSAGLYRFAVNLVTFPSGGGYFIGILPVITAVPAPASLPMAISGLAAIAWLLAGRAGRRRLG